MGQSDPLWSQTYHPRVFHNFLSHMRNVELARSHSELVVRQTLARETVILPFLVAVMTGLLTAWALAAVTRWTAFIVQ